MQRRPLLGMIAAGLVLVVAVAAWLLARPGTRLASQANPVITIECTGASGADAETCLDWGEAVLAEDPAPHTFEREDVRRVRIDRSAFGFGAECRVEYFLSRYPDSPVWSGEIACR